MQAQIRLGRIFGIEIGLHYSWLIIAVLIATSLAGHFSEAYPDWAATIIWTTAITTPPCTFDHTLCSRWRRSDWQESCGRDDRVLDGHRWPTHERTDRGALP